MENDNKQLSDIVDNIVDKAYKIIEWKIIAATEQRVSDDQFNLVSGLPVGYMNFDHEVLNSVLDMVKPLLSSAQQTKKVEAETAKDIVKLIKSGKLSIEDAMKLMNLLKSKVEVEEKESKQRIQDSMYDLLE